MDYFIVALLTIFSCLIFEKLGIPGLVLKLGNSYRSQLQAMQNKALSDEDKQKILLQQTPKQLLYLAKLVGGIILFISPFILIVLFDNSIPWFQSVVLYSIPGILVSIAAVFLYILLKKQYVKVLNHRKNTP